MTIISKIVSRIRATTIREKELDIRPHFVPINLEILNLTLGKVIVTDPKQIFSEEELKEIELYNIDISDKVISLQELKTKIKDYLVKTHKNRLDISGSDIVINKEKTVKNFSDLIKQHTPAVVYRNGEVVGALYSTYDSAQKSLFSNFLNKEISQFLSKAAYLDTNYKIGFDVGHLLGKSDLANSPLAEKFKKLIQILNSISEGTYVDVPGGYVTPQVQGGVTKLKIQVEDALNTLYQKSTYGERVEIEISKDFDLQQFLLSINANIVIIQDRYENQYLYAQLLEGPLSRYIAGQIGEANFSNNIYQEIEETMTSIIKTGKVKKPSTKKTISGKDTLQKSLSSKKLKVTSNSSKSPVKVKLPKLRGKPAAETGTSNLSNLQNIINSLLHQKIKENMGTGSSRNILNYRTGRFAESVKVEKISQSRQGMITAYYNYMQYPYATFSEGGRQEFPRSRDPKLLISKSIREIMQQQMVTRMRAQLI